MYLNVVLQSLSHVQLFVTPWTAARQASCPSLSPVLMSLLRLMFTKLVMPSNHLALCHSLLLPSIFPSIRVFSNKSASRLFVSGTQSIGTSVSALVPPMFIQNWFPLGLTCLISMQSKRLSRVFSNTTVQKLQCSSSMISFLYDPTLTSIHDYWKSHSFD